MKNDHLILKARPDFKRSYDYYEYIEVSEYFDNQSGSHTIISNDYDLNKLADEIGLYTEYNNIPSIDAFWGFLIPKCNIYFYDYNIIVRLKDKHPVGLFGYVQDTDKLIKYSLFERLYSDFIKKREIAYSIMDTNGFFIVNYDKDLKIMTESAIWEY